jgi:hypothetical protein
VNVPESEHVTRARALVDEATHATEHITRPDWCLDGAVPATQMTTERGNLRITRESCRYCLTDRAAAIGLGAALTAYLTTPPPPRKPITEADVDAELERRRARAEHEAALIAEQESAEAAYLATLDPAAREVYDVLDREVFRYHYYDDDVKATLVTELAAAVRRGDAETTRGAHAPEQPGEFAPLIPDTPLFTIEGESQ